MTEDPLATLAGLEGVGTAAAQARDSVDAVLRHAAMRRSASAVAATSAVRGARASAELAGGDPDDEADPYLRGALRALAELPALARTFERAPLQALARTHLLVARDLLGPDTSEGVSLDGGLLARDELGRPVAGAPRLEQLCRLVTGPSAAPGVVVAAVAHAELISIAPFAAANDLVARVLERIVLVVRGVDTKLVSVPEVGHLRLVRAYAPLLAAYQEGSEAGVGAWVRHCCEAYAYGAEEGLAICAELPA